MTQSDPFSILQMRIWASLRDFAWGIVKRWYVLLPALALDPFDLVERFSEREWDPPLWMMWAIFGFSLFVAAWLTYREIWIDSSINRLVKLLSLRREGERLVGNFREIIQIANNVPKQGEAEAVVAVRDKVVEGWLERVRENLQADELSVFNGDQTSGSVLDIDIDLVTGFDGLTAHLTERVSRLDDICEGIKHG